MAEGKSSAKINFAKIHKYLDVPNRQRFINEDDRIGEAMGLGVNMEMGVGSLIPIQATPVRTGRDRKDGASSYLSMVHTTGNIERVMDESRKVASTAILHLAEQLGIDAADMSTPVHLHFMGGSTKKDGPSAGAAIALALASLFGERKIRRDVAITGEIDTQGRITGVGGMGVKLETAYAAGCKTLIIPRENLTGTEGIDRLPDALKQELQILTFEQWKAPHEPFDYSRHMLQVVAVDDIVQASEVAFIKQDEIDSLDHLFEEHARKWLAEVNSARASDFKRVRVLYVDSPDEADPGPLRRRFLPEDHGCIILVRNDLGEEVFRKTGGTVREDRDKAIRSGGRAPGGRAEGNNKRSQGLLRSASENIADSSSAVPEKRGNPSRGPWKGCGFFGASDFRQLLYCRECADPGLPHDARQVFFLSGEVYRRTAGTMPLSCHRKMESMPQRSRSFRKNTGSMGGGPKKSWTGDF